METIHYQPIGVIRSPFQEPVGMPIQAAAAEGIKGRIELDPAFQDGLVDITGFSHLILLYHLHLARPSGLIVTPFLDAEPHGVFATRSPRRPNPIGLSIVRLTAVTGTTLSIVDVDIVDGTPLLDIKPFVPQFDSRVDVRTGWLAANVARMRDVRAGD